MTKSALSAVLLAGSIFSAPLFADAADSRYGTWSPPGSSSGSTAATGASTENLLKDLKSLVDEAEKARAADRLFLRDLRDLIARYERPWTEQILFDDFRDGEFKSNPAWTLASGEFWVEQGYGLRSKAAEGSSTSSGEQKMSKEQLAISILGAVLQGANKNGGGSTTTTTTTTQAEPAVLRTGAQISNAFAISSDFSSWKDAGSYTYAVTQGNKGAGYRVVYTPKQGGAAGATLELVRVTSRGQGTIDKVSLTTLEDQKNHRFDWTRGKDGAMAVSIDNKAVLNARDASFRDPFDAVQLMNTGADVIVKSIEVLGMK